jgi:RsiW-degrading membrane proteinase PrsW (M82 family)
MNMISVLVAAIAPGMALLCYFYLKDRYHAEPVRLVVKMFLLGALLVLPVMVMQSGLVPGIDENSFTYSFLISAGLEEFCKWFVVYFIIYKHAVFDEPYDGIVYAVAVSLGFATLENIFYALLHYSDFSVLLFRAFLPVSGHAMFGVTMGYYMGKAKFRKQRQTFYIGLSLAAPVFYHGIFDYILATAKAWLWLMVPLMLFLWVRTLWNVNRANARSPYRLVHSEEEIKV